MSTLTDLLKVSKRSGKHPSLITEIDKFFYKEFTDDVSEKNIQISEAKVIRRLMQKRKEMFRRRKAEYRLLALHPSQISGCARQNVYRLLQAPAEEQGSGVGQYARLQRIFSNGDFFHLRMQVLLIRMGITDINNVEVEFKTSDGYAGTCDGIIKLDVRAVLELKSMNYLEFNKLQAPKPEHIEQAHMYMWGLNLSRAYILYECKNTQSLKEFIIDYDSKLVGELLKRGKRIWSGVKNVKLPKRDPSYNVSKPPCRFCKFATLCFSPMREKKWIKRKRKELANGPASN